MRLLFGPLVLGVACGGEPAVCAPLEDGAWVIDGPAMGMPMGFTLTMDEEACEFTFSEWSMEMYSLPYQGTIEVDALQLDGDAHWSSCTGVVEASGTAASGHCSDDDTTFTLALGELSASY